MDSYKVIQCMKPEEQHKFNMQNLKDLAYIQEQIVAEFLIYGP